MKESFATPVTSQLLIAPEKLGQGGTMACEDLGPGQRRTVKDLAKWSSNKRRNYSGGVQQQKLRGGTLLLSDHVCTGSRACSVVPRYQLRPNVVPAKNPRLHKATAVVELKELDNQLQRVKQGPIELRLSQHIILIALRLSIKLAAQCQLGVMMLHLTKPMQEPGETSMGIRRAIAMIPTKNLWKWVPNIHSLMSPGPTLKTIKVLMGQFCSATSRRLQIKVAPVQSVK